MDENTKEKIGRLTRREFAEDEIYTFPVTLCDNEIDRDGERFSDAALDKMAELFIGKTGIFDHNPTADNQAARIYDTEVITVPERKTAWGGAYRYLKGYAYMVKTDSNADLITEIDAGIKKEVSVSCSSASCKCSVCGQELRGANSSCEHSPGKEYSGEICHRILDGITDAYEWSFVAVPAQPEAGVTKQYKGGTDMDKFTPITTQEALDAAVQPLIDAAVTAKAAEYAGWLSPEAHLQALDAAETQHRTALLKAYRAKAAAEHGLPEEMTDRLSGETEEEINADAQALAELFRKSAPPSPKFSADGATDTRTAAQLEMLAALKK